MQYLSLVWGPQDNQSFKLKKVIQCSCGMQTRTFCSQEKVSGWVFQTKPRVVFKQRFSNKTQGGFQKKGFQTKVFKQNSGWFSNKGFQTKLRVVLNKKLVRSVLSHPGVE